MNVCYIDYVCVAPALPGSHSPSCRCVTLVTTSVAKNKRGTSLLEYFSNTARP
jgi:hypothetical protein